MPRPSPRTAASRRHKPKRGNTRDSGERLILAAERLFAERGIDGVSLREITRAAGHKNVSGLQYHFGTKMNLLEAVWNHRVPEIDVRRKAMLDEMKKVGGLSNLRRLLEAMVVPFVEQLDSGTNERFYVRFVAQLYSHPAIREADLASAGYRETYQATQRLLEAKLPARLARQRLALVVGHMIHALADLESRLVKQGRQATPERIELFANDLLDTAVGALTVPVSPATAALLRRS